MGIGTSTKETTLHYYRDPLVDVISKDEDVNLRGIIIYGSADGNKDKLRVAERIGVLVEALRVEGAVLSCNGMGNNHIDYAQTIEEIEKRGIPTAALSIVPKEEFVIQNEYLEDSVVCFYKTYDKAAQVGDETTVLAENTVNELDARKALARLKLRMRKKK
jgi:D-proline reductase (dithiol) PrdE